MTGYPILVEKWPARSNASLELGCNNCDYAWSEQDPEDALRKADHGDCPSCGSFDIAFHYEEGVACRNCRKLDYEMPLEGCCSRRCLLQAQYAAELR